MADTTDVTQPEPSTGTAGAPVTGDRPIQNVVGEFNRKFGSIEQRMEQLVSAVSGLAAMQQAPQQQVHEPEAPKGALVNMTDEQLWEQAKQGNKEAFDLHQERQAARTYVKIRGMENEHNIVEGQMNAILGKYPVLRNAQHPLTQTANYAYQLYLKQGRPANKATLLEATKTAIADRPDLVAELVGQVPRQREEHRARAAQSSGMTGTSYRQDEPQRGGGNIRVTSEEAALAKRMNIADPAKAKARFLERVEKGQSTFGAIGPQVDLENF